MPRRIRLILSARRTFLRSAKEPDCSPVSQLAKRVSPFYCSCGWFPRPTSLSTSIAA